ncbi:MAG: tRNA uridine-5-carboxymethylaminomethyl(34) synthesis GTPase MnmE [Saprospiraceae bacterium]|nr:tRNA uridine-5-carboxymethylaminomethyl(34) synthesis GTPase MnmE [Candidatus Vicinibacter affinis]MBK8641944.1 tRNA uridine-5-carboxymethylaminomethyl(34) synthesis GTPase MnmE [Candidatus Vicinibacter affinis]
MDYNNSKTTIVAIATPEGVGAVGMIRLSGPEAFNIANQVFKGKKISQQKSHTAHLGRIIDEQTLTLDEVLATVFNGPHSYTGENIVEFSCHGSPYILKEILELLIRKGAVMAKPGEFTQRAFLNGKLDLSQAEAVADLIASESEAAHRLAMSQLKGGIKNEIAELRNQLLNFASLIELELDFAEEDVEFADRTQFKQLLHAALNKIDSLHQSFVLGNAVKNGISTVIAGRPNAGKSTLLNALLEEERAIVSDIAGTTRDTIEEKMNINGVLFRFIDTAGIREAQDQIEAMGVQRTMEKINESTVLIYVFDVIKTSKEEMWQEVASLIRPNQRLLVVANKMDLNPYIDYEHFVHPNIPKENIIACSAKNLMNIPYLKDKLYQMALGDQKIQSTSIAINARHRQALESAAINLREVLNGLDTHLETDLLAQSIRQALYHLAEISGAISNEEILGNIFGKFCIGK